MIQRQSLADMRPAPDVECPNAAVVAVAGYIQM